MDRIPTDRILNVLYPAYCELRKRGFGRNSIRFRFHPENFMELERSGPPIMGVSFDYSNPHELRFLVFGSLAEPDERQRKDSVNIYIGNGLVNVVDLKSGISTDVDTYMDIPEDECSALYYVFAKSKQLRRSDGYVKVMKLERIEPVTDEFDPTDITMPTITFFYDDLIKRKILRTVKNDPRFLELTPKARATLDQWRALS